MVLIPAAIAVVTVEPAGVEITDPQTSQSPAVSEIEAMFVDVAVVKETADPDAVTYSPTLPAFALLFVVVPTTPAVCEGVMVDVNVCMPDQVLAPFSKGTAAPLVPIVLPLNVAALMLVLHVKPLLVIQLSALADVLHDGIANAAGAALDPVALARTVFAAIAAMPFRPIPPHAGALEAPVETIAWPLLEPVGLSS
nr:hypothetical protein HUO10_003350 [Paraburkholderia busanensis]